MKAATTLFELIKACDSAIVDGYEVTEFRSSGELFELHWCDGDDRCLFADQPIQFVDGLDGFDVLDTEGKSRTLEFFGQRPRLMGPDPAIEALLEWLEDNVGMGTDIHFDNDGQIKSEQVLNALQARLG